MRKLSEKLPNQCKEQTKYLLRFSHYTSPHLKYDGYALVKNELRSHIYSLGFRFNICFIRLENLAKRNNPACIQ